MRMMLGVLALALSSAPTLAAEPVEPTYGEPTPEAARAALNREQAGAARRQSEANLASKQAFEAAQAANEEQIRRDQDAYEQEKVRLASEHEAAMQRWREDIAACRAGEWKRCKGR